MFIENNFSLTESNTNEMGEQLEQVRPLEVKEV